MIGKILKIIAILLVLLVAGCVITTYVFYKKVEDSGATDFSSRILAYFSQDWDPKKIDYFLNIKEYYVGVGDSAYSRQLVTRPGTKLDIAKTFNYAKANLGNLKGFKHRVCVNVKEVVSCTLMAQFEKDDADLTIGLIPMKDSKNDSDKYKVMMLIICPGKTCKWDPRYK